MTARLMLTAALAKAKAALVYDLIDDGTDPNDQEANFGLYDYDFKPKQAATAFKTLRSLMSGCNKYEFTVSPAQDTLTAVFHSDDHEFVRRLVFQGGLLSRHLHGCSRPASD